MVLIVDLWLGLGFSYPVAFLLLLRDTCEEQLTNDNVATLIAKKQLLLQMSVNT